jgi:hypothetical protein
MGTSPPLSNPQLLALYSGYWKLPSPQHPWAPLESLFVIPVLALLEPEVK